MPPNIFARPNIQFDTFPDGRKRLFVLLGPSKSGAASFEWTPHWMPKRDALGVTELLREAVRVERANRPLSELLKEFATLARDIIIEHAPPLEIERAWGKFTSYADNRITVNVGSPKSGGGWWSDRIVTWEMGITLPTEALRHLALQERAFTWVVWDGKVIDVRRSNGKSLLADDDEASY